MSRKLSMIPFMTSSKVLKVDYDILFKKIQTQSEIKQMDFYGFCDAFEQIIARLFGADFKGSKTVVMHEVVDKIKTHFKISHRPKDFLKR